MVELQIVHLFLNLAGVVTNKFNSNPFMFSALDGYCMFFAQKMNEFKFENPS